jgi:hypothetical protein
LQEISKKIYPQKSLEKNKKYGIIRNRKWGHKNGMEKNGAGKNENIP